MVAIMVDCYRDNRDSIPGRGDKSELLVMSLWMYLSQCTTINMFPLHNSDSITNLQKLLK